MNSPLDPAHRTRAARPAAATIGDITLSFDNGPTVEVTPGVLNVLARHRIKASFFVLGKHLQTEQTKALIKQAADAGHWIGNHTYTHSVPLGRQSGDDVAEREIGRTQQCLEGVVHPDKLFRPFGGGGAIGDHLLSGPVLRYLIEGGYTCVLWNSIPRDWAEPEAWVETALEQCRQLPWALVVLHDYDTGAMVHLERFIERALAEGARFRQDFPPECVPLVSGQVRGDMAAYVAAESGGR